MRKEIICADCGKVVETFRNPVPTVDIIIRYEGKILLIERGELPSGLAIPGGYVEYGESLETAAVREGKEETGLDLVNLEQFHAYSDPDRDSRQHNISVVFHADGRGNPKAGSDARNIVMIEPENIENYEFAFDHKQILLEYRAMTRKNYGGYRI